MAGETLKPTPRGRWERALNSSQWWLMFIAIFASSVFREVLGFWESLAVMAAIVGLGTLFVARKANPEIMARKALDAEQGLLECAIRYADAHPDSLRGRWLPGFAEVTEGRMRFQPDYAEAGSPSGRITEFSDVVIRGLVSPPPKRPPEVKRRWQIIVLGTDKGELHVAAGDTGLQLLEDRLGSPTDEK